MVYEREINLLQTKFKDWPEEAKAEAYAILSRQGNILLKLKKINPNEFWQQLVNKIEKNIKFSQEFFEEFNNK